MNHYRRTFLLAMLLIAAAVAVFAAWSHLETCRSRADAGRADLAACRSKLAMMDARTGAAGGTSSDEVPIDHKLGKAATAVSLDQHLASTDFGTPVRIGDSNFVRTTVSVRLNGVTMRQVVGFLVELSAGDDTVRTTDLQLAPSLVAAPVSGDAADHWTADVTLTCTSFSPKPQ